MIWTDWLAERYPSSVPVLLCVVWAICVVAIAGALTPP